MVVNGLGDGKRQTAAAESQTLYYIGLLGTLHELVFTYNAYIGHATCNGLGYVVITKEQDLDRKVSGLYQKCSFGYSQAYA